MIVAAEREFGRRIKLTARQVRRELDLARRQHVGRNGDNCRAARNRATRRLDIDAGAHAPADAGRGRVELHRNFLSELRQHRAIADTAERIDVALQRAREIQRRNLVQILAAAIGTERELDGLLPVTEILRQRLRTGNVTLARGLIDGAMSADLRRKIILHFAFAGIAAADPHLLARRRAVNVDAHRRRLLDHRIEIRHVDPVRATVERHTKGLGIGDTASADVIARLNQRELAARRSDTPRRGDTRSACANDDDIDFARHQCLRTGRSPTQHRRGKRRCR